MFFLSGSDEESDDDAANITVDASVFGIENIEVKLHYSLISVCSQFYLQIHHHSLEAMLESKVTKFIHFKSF